MWIGATDAVAEGAYRWDGVGVALEWTNWYLNPSTGQREPNGGALTNVVMARDAFDWAWVDVTPISSRNYLCQSEPGASG